MKNFKQFFSILIVSILALLTCIGVKALSDTITLGDAEKLPNYMENINTFHIKKMTNGELLYCLNMHANVAENTKATLQGKTNTGLTYILENGYPNKKFTGNNKKDYYITQVAVWMYLDDTTNSSNLTSAFRNQSGEMMNYANELVKNAKTATTNDDLEIEIASSSTKMKLDGDYYISENISAGRLKGSENVQVTATGASNIEIIDTNNNPVTTVHANDYFRVRVPAANVTDQTSIVVTASISKTIYQGYKYSPTDSKMQNVARLTKTNKTAKSVLTLTAIPRPTVTINKVDAETGQNISGAVIAVYNERGTEVRRFTTGPSPYLIVDLEDGTYTIQEIVAPNGYMINESPFKITIDSNNRNHSITIENYKEVVVPNTDINDKASTIFVTLLGIIVLGLGVFYIRKYEKA